MPKTLNLQTINMYFCRPHFHKKIIWDCKHLLHFFTLGIMLINHTEPNGEFAIELHKKK